MGPSFRVSAIRLDSGDLAALAVASRRILDEGGLERVQIVASSSLNEYEIARLLDAGAPIDGFGVGTEMGVSRDVPTVDIVYKLVEYAGRGRVKLAPGKEVLPGRKQVFRVEQHGIATHDVLAGHDEAIAGRPLLEPVMKGGVRLPAGRVTLPEVRRRAAREVAALPPRVRHNEPARPSYQVELSAGLTAAGQRLRR